jgi:CheY-like chemotaxis protein
MPIDFLDILRSWFITNQQRFTATPVAITFSRVSETDNPAQYVDIDFLHEFISSRITIWCTGECDIETLSDKEHLSFWKHYEFTSSDALNDALNDLATLLINPANKSPESKKISLISNEIEIYHIFKAYFEAYNYYVFDIPPDREISLSLQLSNPDIVVVKIFPENNIPDSFEVCRLIRANEMTAAIPVIVISPKKNYALEAGATDWSDIVFDIEKIRHKIEQLTI